MQAQACPWQSRLVDFYEGTLATEPHLAVGRHLRECSQCRRHAQSLGKSTPSSKSFPVPAIDSPTAKVSMEETAVSETLPLMEEIGPYLVRRMIGRGGMGTVYEALHKRLGRSFALKVLPRPVAFDPESLARFEREVRAVGQLEHPNVVRATDAGDANGMPYLAMELVDGIDLAKLLRTTGPLALDEASDVIRQAALGLAHAHGKGIVHRDVKPSNLMLTSRGVVQVLDLGLAVFVSSIGSGDGALTGPTILGTHDYMAPEQWSNSTQVTDRADVYGLGCVLYQLLLGKPPYAQGPDDSPQMKRRAHAEDTILSLRSRRPELPTALSNFASSMLAKDPVDRPSCSRVAERMVEFAAPAKKLGRLVERVRLAPGSGFSDGAPTAAMSAPSILPTVSADVPKPGLARGQRLVLVALGIIGLILATGLVLIATGAFR